MIKIYLNSLCKIVKIEVKIPQPKVINCNNLKQFKSDSKIKKSD